MSYIFLLVFLVGTTPPPNGSLIFLANNNLVIEQVTHSTVTHVAIILYDNNEPFVYEVKPVVKRTRLHEFLNEFSKKPNIHYLKTARIQIAYPKIPYTQKQLYAMKSYADSQMGRLYSVRAYTTGHPVYGIHCSEFVTKILICSGRVKSDNPGRVTPEILLKALNTTYSFSQWHS